MGKEEDKEITPETIEGFLIDGMGSGELEFAGMKNGDISVSITEKGEQRVFEILGGKDVAEVSHKIYNLLVKHGALGFDVKADFGTFTIIAQIMSIVKHYESWEALKIAVGKS